MSVLHLRRDMVVVEEEPVVEIDAPFPLRTIKVEEIGEVAEFAEVEEIDEDRERSRKSLLRALRWWFNAASLALAILAYPVMMVASSDVGDANLTSMVDRTRWIAPWAGGASTLMEKHFNKLGWASDAPGWSPMARLTAKPAYQTAMAGAVGEFISLTHTQVVAAGQSDPDLAAAARLVSSSSTAVQLRAARDALVSYDRRLKRRNSGAASTPGQIADQLKLIDTWAVASQAELAASSASIGGSPIDDAATRAVYGSKGRGMAAWTFIDALHWPDAAKAAPARAGALAAWEQVAEFHPLLVLNGAPDGSLLGNHTVSMGFLISQAQLATQEFANAVVALAAAPAVAEVVPAGQQKLRAEPPATEPAATERPATRRPSSQRSSSQRSSGQRPSGQQPTLKQP